MLLATTGLNLFLFSSPNQPFHCRGSSKVDRIQFKKGSGANRRCECYDLHKELVPYKQAWSWQKSIVERRHALVDRDEDHADNLIVLQHPPVYTLGTASLEKYLKFDIQNSPYDVYRTERGGEVTYHGPGQLVLYPLLNLRYHKMDLHWYLRSLEEVVIQVLQSTFSIKASRLEGFTGVWVGNEKIAAIGIRVSRWIAYHGLALNVSMDLTPFQRIVPCGIRDREVGSLSGLLGRLNGSIDANKDLMDATYESLLKEFSEVFQLSLEQRLISNLDLVEEESRA